MRDVQDKGESETMERTNVVRTSRRPPKLDPEVLMLIEQERKERLAMALSMYEPFMTEKNRPVLEFHQRMRCAKLCLRYDRLTEISSVSKKD